MSARERISTGIKSVLRGPVSSAPVARAAEALGAHTLADRLDRIRSDGDLVPVTVPAGDGALRTHRFRMHGLGGRDQVARALRAGGWQAFEAPLPSVVAELVRRRPTTVLDVGANTGFYSLVAVTAHADAKAIAYEPVPEIVDLLRTNLAVNPQGRRIALRSQAVSDHTGPVDLHLPPPQPDGTVETSASVESDFKESIERVVTVAGTTLDDAWKAEGRPVVDLVKIDVEGAEHRVLAGAVEVAATCRPVLTIEVLPAARLDDMEAFRHAHGYLDVTLGEIEAVVNRPKIAHEPGAPNHLLVPQERVAAVTDALGSVPGLVVTVLH